MLQHTKRQVQLFVLHYFTVFITFCVCSFSYETSMVEEQESLGSCSLVPAYDIFPPWFLCSPKPLENPHYSLEMKLHSQFVPLFLKPTEIRSYVHSNRAINCF